MRKTTKKLLPVDAIAQADHARLTQVFLDKIEEEYGDLTLQEIVDLLNAYWNAYAISN